MIDKRDYYDVLGVSRDASEEIFKRAYLKVAVRYLPDESVNDKVSEEKFTEAGEAYEVLSCRDRRAVYDRYGHCAFTNNEGFRNPYEIFNEAFGGGMFESKPERPPVDMGATTKGTELGKCAVDNEREPKHDAPVSSRRAPDHPDLSPVREEVQAKGEQIHSRIIKIAQQLGDDLTQYPYKPSLGFLLLVNVIIVIAALAGMAVFPPLLLLGIFLPIIIADSVVVNSWENRVCRIFNRLIDVEEITSNKKSSQEIMLILDENKHLNDQVNLGSSIIISLMGLLGPSLKIENLGAGKECALAWSNWLVSQAAKNLLNINFDGSIPPAKRDKITNEFLHGLKRLISKPSFFERLAARDEPFKPLFLFSRPHITYSWYGETAEADMEGRQS